MVTGNVASEPLAEESHPPATAQETATAGAGSSGRYRPLPTGTHGLDPALVKVDQCQRLQSAMIELVARKGYPAVRIADLAKLAHVSQPTFYSLYADKEELFLSAYDEIAQRTALAVMRSYEPDGSREARLRVALHAFAELAVAEPESMSMLVLGAFGAGPRALERRRTALDALERSIITTRDRTAARGKADLTIKAVLGGIREVTAERLRTGRAQEMPAVVDELADWAACYPRKVPSGLGAPEIKRREPCPEKTSARARRAEGRLPSGRSDLPRQFIVKSQRERIVDATAAIVSEKGLAGLTIPEIARRANVSNQTFYSIYPSKHEAFLGAQKVGMHQALQVAVKAYQAQGDDWPRAVAAGLGALIDYLASEPAHAHLNLVDTFAASPQAIEIRTTSMHAFASYLRPGLELVEDPTAVPQVTAEAVAGGIWQVFHHYIENECVDQLPEAAPQLTYMALTPFIGAKEAATVARAAKQAAAGPA